MAKKTQPIESRTGELYEKLWRRNVRAYNLSLTPTERLQNNMLHSNFLKKLEQQIYLVADFDEILEK